MTQRPAYYTNTTPYFHVCNFDCIMRAQWINGGMCLTSNEEMIRSGARFDEAARLWLRITCELQTTCSLLVILFAPWTKYRFDDDPPPLHVSPIPISRSFCRFLARFDKNWRERGSLFLSFSFFDKHSEGEGRGEKERRKVVARTNANKLSL